MAIKRSIELTIVSATDLKKVKTFGRQACYAVPYIISTQKLATLVDKDGGVNPTWDSKFTLTFDESLLQQRGSAITVDIYCLGSFSDKLVGTASIPLRSHVDIEAENQVKPMAFVVKKPSGRVRGVLNVSLKLLSVENPSSIFQQTPATRVFSTSDASLSGYALNSDNKQQGWQAGQVDEPVMGYPVTGSGTVYPPQPQYHPLERFYDAPYSYEQAYYSRPQTRRQGAPRTRRQGGAGSSAGVGLLGVALTALLIGDVVGGF